MARTSITESGSAPLRGEARDRGRVRVQVVAQLPERGGRVGRVVARRRRRRAARRRRPGRRARGGPAWRRPAGSTGAEWNRIPTGKPSARCSNIGSAVIIDGAYLVATPAVKRPWVMKYCWNSSGSTPSAGVRCAVLGGVGAEHLGELAVEVDELLGDLLPLVRVGVQQFGLGPALQHRGQLPAQVPGVVHGHVHALAGLGAVRVAGVAGDEHPRQAGVGISAAGTSSNLSAQSLADLVHRPPADVLDVDRVRVPGSGSRPRPASPG